MSGIYVTRKVFEIVFKPSAKPMLVKHLRKEFGLTEVEASQVVEAVDLLPASKRRAEDTYLVLGDKQVTNLTNTEFPDHQLKVLQKSREVGFELSDFANSIASGVDESVLMRLLEMPDFLKAYSLNPKLIEDLNEIGIEVPTESGGLEPDEWSAYGPVRKTMEEFNNAYVSFRDKLVNSVAQTPVIREK
jgi:hypothetical protein